LFCDEFKAVSYISAQRLEIFFFFRCNFDGSTDHPSPDVSVPRLPGPNLQNFLTFQDLPAMRYFPTFYLLNHIRHKFVDKADNKTRHILFLSPENSIVEFLRPVSRSHHQNTVSHASVYLNCMYHQHHHHHHHQSLPIIDVQCASNSSCDSLVPMSRANQNCVYSGTD